MRERSGGCGYPRLFGKGRVVDEMVLNIDLAPTFLDLAGVPVPKEMQGASWKELAAGRKPANWRQSFFAEYYKELGDVPTLYAVRTTTHKLVKYPNHPEWTEVFDLAAAPYEIKNLASDATLTAKLEAELDGLVKAVNYSVTPNTDKPPPATKAEGANSGPQPKAPADSGATVGRQEHSISLAGTWRFRLDPRKYRRGRKMVHRKAGRLRDAAGHDRHQPERGFQGRTGRGSPPPGLVLERPRSDASGW